MLAGKIFIRTRILFRETEVSPHEQVGSDFPLYGKVILDIRVTTIIPRRQRRIVKRITSRIRSPGGLGYSFHQLFLYMPLVIIRSINWIRQRIFRKTSIRRIFIFIITNSQIVLKLQIFKFILEIQISR